MPLGRGESGEIILVIDSTRWAGEIGKELRLTFRETVEGLPREEPLFDLRQVVPTNFKGIQQKQKSHFIVWAFFKGHKACFTWLKAFNEKCRCTSSMTFYCLSSSIFLRKV